VIFLSELKYFDDFSLGDIRLSSFNGIKYNPDSDGIKYDVMPEPVHTTINLPNVHGKYHYKTVYDTRLITIPVFVNGSLDIDKFNAWVGNCDEQVFYYCNQDGSVDYKEIDVVYNRGIDITSYWSKDYAGFTSLEFIAHSPLWRVRNEDHKIIINPVINKIYPIISKTNIKAKPIIKITPNGNQTISFSLNELVITLTNISESIYIDSSNGEVYTINNGIKVNAFSKFYSNGWYELPIIKPFVINQIKVLSGVVSEIDITLNSRMI
jgi:phage-related protein